MAHEVAPLALVVALTAAGAWAQEARVEIGAAAGWTFSDGVSGDPIQGGDGKYYDRVDPKNSLSYGANIGFYVTPNVEVGFLWDRQASTLQVSGGFQTPSPQASTTMDVADLSIDNYHGYVTYEFGDAGLRPYVLGGLGATRYGDVTFNALGQQHLIKGRSKFSTTWELGVKIVPRRGLGLRLGARWTPTHVKSDEVGWWCDPWYGCYVVTHAQYSNQFELSGGVLLRF